MINCVKTKCFYFAFLTRMRRHIPRGRVRRLIRLPAAAFDLTWWSSRRVSDAGRRAKTICASRCAHEPLGDQSGCDPTAVSCGSRAPRKRFTERALVSVCSANSSRRCRDRGKSYLECANDHTRNRRIRTNSRIFSDSSLLGKRIRHSLDDKRIGYAMFLNFDPI